LLSGSRRENYVKTESVRKLKGREGKKKILIKEKRYKYSPSSSLPPKNACIMQIYPTFRDESRMNG